MGGKPFKGHNPSTALGNLKVTERTLCLAIDMPKVLCEDFREQFDESFIKRVKRAQEQLKKGEGTLCKNGLKRSQYFKSL